MIQYFSGVEKKSIEECGSGYTTVDVWIIMVMDTILSDIYIHT